MATQVKSKIEIENSAQNTRRRSNDGQSPTGEVREISAKNRRAIEFLDSMDNATPEEIQEQKETWAFLKKALDEDRLSPNRPLFPSEEEATS